MKLFQKSFAHIQSIAASHITARYTYLKKKTQFKIYNHTIQLCEPAMFGSHYYIHTENNGK